MKTYCVIPKVISLELCKFLTDYFLLKRKVATTLFKFQYLSPFSKEWGTWTDIQVPKTYCHYGDVAMDILLPRVQPILEKKLKLKLYPTYTYARIYKKGDVLERHKDRPSCEISATMFLGGDAWPIYLEPNSNLGGRPSVVGEYTPSKSKGIEVMLKEGDILIYKGCEMEHWRKKFKGKDCVQVFLHYNNVDGILGHGLFNLHDNRPHLGLPAWFKGRKDDKK